MKRIILALSLAAVVLLSGTHIYAQVSDPPHKGMHSHESMASHKGPSLTPEQKTKFQEMRRTFIRENAQLIGALVAKRLELRSLWTDPKSDSNAILDKEKELRALQNQMKDKVIQAMLEARKVLTPEQIEKWKPRWRMGHRGMLEGLMGDRMGQDCGMGGGGMMGRGGMRHGGMMSGHEMGHGHGMMGSGQKMESCSCPEM
jgi:Spy/CpxP family protein refolding chaperone